MDQTNPLSHARRQFLKNSGMGLGVAALGSLLPQNSIAQTNVAPAAKHVIFLFMRISGFVSGKW